MTELTDTQLEEWCRKLLADPRNDIGLAYRRRAEDIARALLMRLERERRNRTPESIAMKKILKNQLKRRRLVP